MALNLLQGVKYDSHKDEKRCATKELRERILYIQQSSKSRHYRNECDEQRTRQCYT